MKLLQKVHSLSIKTKLFTLIFMFLCIPFLVFGVLWYEMTTSTMERNAINSNQQLVEQISGQLDTYFEDLERTTFPLITNPLIEEFIKQPSDDTFELFVTRKKIEEQLMPNILFGRPDMFGFSVFSQNSVSLGFGVAAYKGRYEKYMQELTDNQNYKIIGIGELDQTPVVTFVRKFSDARTYRTIGLIIIDLRLNKIESIIEKIKLGNTGYVWLLDSKNRIVYHPDRGTWGEQIDPTYMEDFANHADTEYYFKQIDGKKQLVIFHRSDRNDWTTISIVPFKEIMGSLVQLRNVTVTVGAALIIFVLFVLSAYSYSISRSLNHLQKLMKRAEIGDLNVRAPEDKQDEFGKLNRSFNKMVSEIKRLIEVVHTSKLREKELQIKQREAMMQAMQSQINPHFLYNTLEVINSHAVVESVMPISHMATALADMFRYSVGNPQQIVMLKEEIEHINIYFEIQKERYPHLIVENQVDETFAENVGAIRLIIQPLVENIFIHAYERNKLKPTFVGLSGFSDDSCYTLHITDKGLGMEAALREKYNSFFGHHDLDVLADDDLPFKRIGLWNVHHRIRLNYGAHFGLYIVKSDPSGTVIEVKLPINRTTNHI